MDRGFHRRRPPWVIVACAAGLVFVVDGGLSVCPAAPGSRSSSCSGILGIGTQSLMLLCCLPSISARRLKNGSFGEAGHLPPASLLLCPNGLRHGLCRGQRHFEMGCQATHVGRAEDSFRSDSQFGLRHELVRQAVLDAVHPDVQQAPTLRVETCCVSWSSSDGWPRRPWSATRRSCRGMRHAPVRIEMENDREDGQSRQMVNEKVEGRK